MISSKLVFVVQGRKLIFLIGRHVSFLSRIKSKTVHFVLAVCAYSNLNAHACVPYITVNCDCGFSASEKLTALRGNVE